MKNIFPFPMMRLYAAAMLSLTLSGCLLGAGSPATHWYILPSPADTQNPQQNVQLNGPRVAVGPISLPGYLDHANIFIRPDAENPTLHASNADEWGEPLDKGIVRVLCASMAAELTASRVAVFPLDFALPSDWKIFINIIRFDGAPGGTVALEADWSFVSTEGKIRRTGRFSDTFPAEGDNIAGMISAQGTLLQHFGTALAKEARRLVR